MCHHHLDFPCLFLYLGVVSRGLRGEGLLKLFSFQDYLSFEVDKCADDQEYDESYYETHCFSLCAETDRCGEYGVHDEGPNEGSSVEYACDLRLADGKSHFAADFIAGGHDRHHKKSDYCHDHHGDCGNGQYEKLEYHHCQHSSSTKSSNRDQNLVFSRAFQKNRAENCPYCPKDYQTHC